VLIIYAFYDACFIAAAVGLWSFDLDSRNRNFGPPDLFQNDEHNVSFSKAKQTDKWEVDPHNRADDKGNLSTF
jgi:hypothetical protein